MSQATTEPTTPTTGDVLARVGETLAALQDAEKTCVEAARQLYEHTQDGNAHGAGLQENIGREMPRPVWQGTALAFQKADGTTVAEAVDLKGRKGDRGEAGPRPEHRWDGTRLTVQNADGSWPENGVDLKGEKGDRGDVGPRPEHRWDGTRLTVQNADGSWPESGVDLKGEKGDAGEVSLADAVDSDSSETAASSLAVKTAYDAATAAQSAADAAGEAAGEAKATAEAASTAAAGATQKADVALAALPRLDALEAKFEESGKVKAEHLPLTDALDSDTGKMAASDAAVAALNAKISAGSAVSAPYNSRVVIAESKPAWASPVTGWAQITLIGGGGGGCGGGGDQYTACSGGSGGGGERKVVYVYLTEGSTYACTIGAGGAGGVSNASGNNTPVAATLGKAGGATKFVAGGVTHTAAGGAGGGAQVVFGFSTPGQGGGSGITKGLWGIRGTFNVGVGGSACTQFASGQINCGYGSGGGGGAGANPAGGKQTDASAGVQGAIIIDYYDPKKENA